MALLAADRRTDCRAADICESASSAAERVGSETLSYDQKAERVVALVHEPERGGGLLERLRHLAGGRAVLPRVVFEGGLASLAGQLMQSSTVRFFHEHVLVKQPGATEPTPWHHDDPYYGIDGLQNVSMWIALDRVPATSRLQFIAGSHLWGRRFGPRKSIDHTPYGAPDGRFDLLSPTKPNCRTATT